MMAAMVFGMGHRQPVVEEKQTRIVEILLPAPYAHRVTGKIIGNLPQHWRRSRHRGHCPGTGRSTVKRPAGGGPRVAHRLVRRPVPLFVWS